VTAPSDEERAESFVRTWCERSLTDDEGTRLLASLISAVRAEERERCASIASNVHQDYDCPDDDCCGTDVAAAIRRGA